MQIMSISVPSCSTRCPQQKCPFPYAFQAISPTRVLSVFFVKRSRCFPCIFAAKQQQEADKPMKKKSGKRKAPEKFHVDGVDVAFEFEAPAAGQRSSHLSPLPKPPAGFVLDDHGRVLLASNKRITTIVDAKNNLPLECVIRRVFQSSQGYECMLLCPVDTPVQILRSTNFNGWSAVNDDEVEAIIPSAAYALAKIHMHLVVSGFCYTARGGFCYSEEDIIEFRTGNIF
ncbi:hypothetical protein IEQ34_004848 [Dendrobium chrysotoxum]|uniref:Uncharacterized protein n=1 Tax=Dendrobium chrysotoxum TaxID=161865 RepID=A0AAV7GSA1_DENCH|nr:hypothetical protein IEQ34_004848 [Dendrobium chrysotoxum]